MWLVGRGQPWEVLEQERNRTHRGLVAGNRADYGRELNVLGWLCLRLLVLLYEAGGDEDCDETFNSRGIPAPIVCIPELAGLHHSQAWSLSTILRRGT